MKQIGFYRQDKNTLLIRVTNDKHKSSSTNQSKLYHRLGNFNAHIYRCTVTPYEHARVQYTHLYLMENCPKSLYTLLTENYRQQIRERISDFIIIPTYSLASFLIYKNWVCFITYYL